MRVLHLSSEKGWRGGEQQIAYLIDEQRKQAIEVIVAVRKGSAFEQHCITNSIPYVAMSFGNSYDLRTALAIKDICKRKKIDLVHMHSAKSHSVGVFSATLGNQTPLILSRRVDFVPKNSFLTRWKYNHPSIKRILCVSDKINEIMRAYVDEPKKVFTVHSGVDTQRFNEKRTGNILRETYGVDTKTTIIGNTAALEKHKDYFTFINAISILVEKGLNVKAFIIGAGSLEQTLKEYVASKNLNEKIIFTGFRKDIIQVLPALDIFLITSNEEGLGTSVLDAFAAGVPTVGTAAGGIPEMIIHETTGLLAPIADDQTLANHIERLMKDPNLRAQLIAGARTKLSEFSKEVTAQRTIKAYHEVLAK